MTRRELIEEVNRNCRFSNKSGVEYIIKLIEDVITKALIQGQTIKLNGFLKLGTKQSSPRKGKFKGKTWKSKSKVVAYAKVSPVINSKIQEHQNMDWLDRFALLSYEEQYDFVKEAQRQIDECMQ
jgi:nucleoid DNA-binding protein